MWRVSKTRLQHWPQLEQQHIHEVPDNSRSCAWPSEAVVALELNGLLLGARWVSIQSRSDSATRPMLKHWETPGTTFSSSTCGLLGTEVEH